VSTDLPGTPDDGLGAGTDLSVISFDDPHLLPFAKNPRRAERVIGAFLFVGLLGCAAYGALYWQGGQTQLEAIFLGGGLFCIGFGLTAWGKYLLPQGPFVEERHAAESSPADRRAMAEALEFRGKAVFRRRGFLGALLGGSMGVMGVVLAFPLLRSLGPRPGTYSDLDPATSMYHTDWRKGRRLVTFDGTPVSRHTLEVGGILTVFPEGFQDASTNAVDQTVLLRPQTTAIKTMPAGRETWTPEGYVAYSKVCTHAGCPVGLYQEETQQLLCPCHQSLFDILEGAIPVFGPAPRPLPQLPLSIDDDGWLRAQADYDQPIGPGFWERTTT